MGVPRLNRLPAEQVQATLEQLNAFDRLPFREHLANALGCSPNPKNVKAFANKYPDRFAQYLMILAKLGGYQEPKDKPDVIVNVFAWVKEASDKELIEKIRQLEDKAIEVKAEIEQSNVGFDGFDKIRA